MNFFEFFELPVRFAIDKDLLRKKYLEKSRQFHPDYFVNETEENRDEVLKQSTINNNAFKILNNDTLRIKYVLESSGLLEEGDKEILPPDFLMEMMELNEGIMEADANSIVEIKSRVEIIENELKNSLQTLCDAYDAKGDKALLHSIKTIYLKQKYLLRIKEAMLKFASF
jgi:molecular chaperone HscB